MIEYAVLGSGSSGNSYVFYDGTDSVVIDQGFSGIEWQRRLERSKVPLSSVRAIFVTHLHPDHVHGAGIIARRHGIAVYINSYSIEREPGMMRKLKIPSSLLFPFEVGEPIEVGNFSLTSFSTSHDSAGSVGWMINCEHNQMMLCTDTGTFEKEHLECASQSDIVFLEANYDNRMLETGPYPPVLKKRISGIRGHLSNDQAVSFLRQSGFKGPVFFIHLSSTNNSYARLKQTVEISFGGEFTICEKGKEYRGSIA